MSRTGSNIWARFLNGNPWLKHRRAVYGVLALITTSICIVLPLRGMTASTDVSREPVARVAIAPATASEPQNRNLESQSDPSALTQGSALEAQQLYAAGRYDSAAAMLRQLLQTNPAAADPVDRAVLLSNLSLTTQQLGAWTEAQTSVDEALTLIQSDAAAAAADRLGVWAQALDVKASLALAMGESESAVEVWAQASELFEQASLPNRAVTSQINRAQALQSLGLYGRAIALLKSVQADLDIAPDTLEKAAVLRSLGESQRVAGDLGEAATILNESRAIAATLGNAEAESLSLLSLGNLARVRANVFASIDSSDTAENNALIETTLETYRQAAQLAETPLTRVQADLNTLNFLIEVERWNDALQIYPSIRPQLAQLSPGRPAIYATVNYAQSLVQLNQGLENEAIAWSEIGKLLSEAYQQAQQLDDTRAQSFVLGHLGELYELTERWSEAQDLTRRALSLSQAINAQDIAYRWQWQLGRVLKEEGNLPQAVSAYKEAFNTLQLLRSDLVSANADVKFSFRKNVEPVYREFVDLLLKPQAEQEISQANLRQARDVMEALQVAQIENFFQSACLEPKLQIDRVIDEQNQRAAVLYPIILSDRLEVIVKLPQDDTLIHYAPTYRTDDEMRQALSIFRTELQKFSTGRLRQVGSVLYDWLIRPADSYLEQNQIETLIFVLDGPLRNVPMATLYDGERYLAEKYALDLVLGLEVSDPQPLNRDTMTVLAAGLIEPPEAFRSQYAPLINVKKEMDLIETSGIRTTVLREQEFKRQNFNEEFNKQGFEVVHLATHGQFGADRENTFILDADGRIPLDDLSELFGVERQISDAPIQLLIMSACRTATGDDQEVLGIAGTTVRAGARSAIASLWSLDDESSVVFTREFYKHLGKPGISRAEAIRLAQIAMMADPNFNHPRYWGAYVLVGSWL
ncbi:MAG: CHAT domain-containing protein [Elainellaceae cyanobacterium]